MVSWAGRQSSRFAKPRDTRLVHFVGLMTASSPGLLRLHAGLPRQSAHRLESHGAGGSREREHSSLTSANTRPRDALANTPRDDFWKSGSASLVPFRSAEKPSAAKSINGR